MCVSMFFLTIFYQRGLVFLTIDVIIFCVLNLAAQVCIYIFLYCYSFKILFEGGLLQLQPSS